MFKTIFYERARTRDLLLEYDLTIMPYHPRAAGLQMVYPWENTNLDSLIKELYQFSVASGFEGTLNEFKNSFGSYLSSKQILFATLTTFPEIGDNKHLYYDTETNILYYYEEEYKPINTLLIEGTILNGGQADEV